MFVGVARMVLSVPGARSLKDKRQVVRSFRDRVRARLSASIAEVGELERYQWRRWAVGGRARLRDCSALLSEVRTWPRGCRGAALGLGTEIIPFGLGGAGVQAGSNMALTRDAAFDDDDDDDAESLKRTRMIREEKQPEGESGVAVCASRKSARAEFTRAVLPRIGRSAPADADRGQRLGVRRSSRDRHRRTLSGVESAVRTTQSS